MNNGKICVSISGRTASELIGQLRRAESAADVVELRLDGLEQADIRTLVEQLSAPKPLLLTMRPKEQGGRSLLSINERVDFWKGILSLGSAVNVNVLVDLEYDLPLQRDLFPHDKCTLIRSRHFFDGPGTELDKTYESLVSDDAVAKIAVSVGDAADAVGVWQLLERARIENKRIIVIAMGEAGKWTRVLGPAYGSFLTYAALDTGGETAPGQITASELSEVFRVRQLDRNTKIYGILAGNTSYSTSPWMHNAAIMSAGLNSVFVPFQTGNVGTFLERMVLPSRQVELNFAGFSVTNPHKEAIIPFLDEIDEASARIGAVNTVKIENGRLTGFNTDAFGFISTLKKQAGGLKDSRVAVFGAGGAARACVFTLVEEGAAVTVIARDDQKGSSLAEEFGAVFSLIDENQDYGRDFDIVVNTTPLGTAGANVDLSILASSQMAGLKLVYDLVYNPAETRLISEATVAGVRAVNGMEMLISQGAKQFEIWTGLEAPVGAMKEAVEKRLGA